MQLITLFVAFSAVGLSVATPLASQPQHGNLDHSSDKHDHRPLSEVCSALQPNETSNLDLHKMTKAQVKCGKYFYLQAHAHNETKREIKIGALPGTMKMCTMAGWNGQCTVENGIQDNVCRKVADNNVSMGPGKDLKCQLWFDSKTCAGKSVDGFSSGVVDWQKDIWGQAVSGGKPPKSYKCVKAAK